jgi:hypothetical protein
MNFLSQPYKVALHAQQPFYSWSNKYDVEVSIRSLVPAPKGKEATLKSQMPIASLDLDCT